MKLGLDASHWNLPNWTALAAAGHRYAFIKATEGGKFVSPAFFRHWEGARGVDLVRGAYHFGRLEVSPEEQVDHFLRIVPDEVGIFYVLDFEFHSIAKTKMTDEQAREFATLLGERRPINRKLLYALEPDVERLMYYPEFDGWFRYVAKYSNEAPKSAWDFWQYTDVGRVTGARDTTIDLNLYNGSEAAWLALTQS